MEKYQLNGFEINVNKITSFELLTNHNECLISREKSSKCLSGCPSKGIGDEKKTNYCYLETCGHFSTNFLDLIICRVLLFTAHRFVCHLSLDSNNIKTESYFLRTTVVQPTRPTNISGKFQAFIMDKLVSIVIFSALVALSSESVTFSYVFVFHFYFCTIWNFFSSGFLSHTE